MVRDLLQIANNFLGERFGYQVVSRNGLKLACRGDPWVRLSRYLEEYLGSEPVILEIGAWRGDLIDKIAEVKPKAKIYAVEPNPYLTALLLQKSFVTDVKELAIGSEDGLTELHVVAGSDQLSSELKLAEPGAKTETFQVKRVTGDNYLNLVGLDEIDLLSVNIQGKEYEALLGFRLTLATGSIKAIKVEVDLDLRYEGASREALSDINRLLVMNGFYLFDVLLVKNSGRIGARMLDLLYRLES